MHQHMRGRQAGVRPELVRSETQGECLFPAKRATAGFLFGQSWRQRQERGDPAGRQRRKPQRASPNGDDLGVS